MKDGKYVILCVDDDRDLLDALRLVLESNGYMVVTARSAEDGLAAYSVQKPDLVIVDLMMEEVDAGTTLVRDLKAAGASVPIYMLSSVGDSLHMQIDATQLGLSGVFQKPIDNKNLLAVLKGKLK